MVSTIRYRPQVHSDLAAIDAMIAAYSGPETAERLVKRIVAAIDKLEHIPKRASLRDEILPGLRVIPAGKYRKADIAFRVHDEIRVVDILLVNYAGGDWQSRIRDRAK